MWGFGLREEGWEGLECGEGGREAAGRAGVDLARR